MTTILGSLDERAHLGIDVADRAVHDEKRLVDVCAYSASGERRFGDHVELRSHPVAVDLELGRRTRFDDPELRAAIQAPPPASGGCVDPANIARPRSPSTSNLGGVHASMIRNCGPRFRLRRKWFP